MWQCLGHCEYNYAEVIFQTFRALRAQRATYCQKRHQTVYMPTTKSLKIRKQTKPSCRHIGKFPKKSYWYQKLETNGWRANCLICGFSKARCKIQTPSNFVRLSDESYRKNTFLRRHHLLWSQDLWACMFKLSLLSRQQSTILERSPPLAIPHLIRDIHLKCDVPGPILVALKYALDSQKGIFQVVSLQCLSHRAQSYGSHPTNYTRGHPSFCQAPMKHSFLTEAVRWRQDIPTVRRMLRAT